MAEIKIEKKSPIWPWILLGVIILGILIYVFASDDDDDNRDGNRDNTEQPINERNRENSGQPMNSLPDNPNNSSVVAFVTFIEEDPDQMGLDHEFTNEALAKLTNATRSMADKVGYDSQKDMQQVRTLAEKITNDPFETTHANSIKEAADVLAQVLQNIQQVAFPGLAGDADNVKNAATDIDTDILTLDQKEDVKNFFKESADLLEKMNNNSPEI